MRSGCASLSHRLQAVKGGAKGDSHRVDAVAKLTASATTSVSPVSHLSAVRLVPRVDKQTRSGSSG